MNINFTGDYQQEYLVKIMASELNGRSKNASSYGRMPAHGPGS
jgi:hypothetical protein